MSVEYQNFAVGSALVRRLLMRRPCFIPTEVQVALRQFIPYSHHSTNASYSHIACPEAGDRPGQLTPYRNLGLYLFVCVKR